MTRKSISFDPATLQRIWDQHRLGSITTVTQASRGINNPAFIINDHYVVRFDGLALEGRSRFYGEALAYEKLREHDIPAPQVIAVDVSKQIVPHDYILMTKIEGATIIDSWPNLTLDQCQQVAQEAGRYLAKMHAITFDGYGKLKLPAAERFPTWYAYVMDYLHRYKSESVSMSILTEAQGNHLWDTFEQHRTLFESVQPARLIHWDFHFENVLQMDGHVTGILDFEWSLCGDPAFDFRLEWQWEDTCPGSAQGLYHGYLAERSLPADQELRVRLYSLLGFLDWAVDAQNDGESIWARQKLLDGLATF
jgi:aminoglycoside phosphotransferase (APT) family kinase protein